MRKAITASLNITEEMAPYKDVNGDGIYNPLNGDYPEMKGEQMLWWVFSDNGPTHDASGGRPLKMTIKALAYAYKRNPVVDNIIFYKYKLQNRSGSSYDSLRAGIWADLEIGCTPYGAINRDSARRLIFEYKTEADYCTDSSKS